MLGAVSGFAVDRHVALTGLDTNPGTLLMPYKTIGKALGARMPGDVIYLHAGTHAAGRGSSLIVPVDVKAWQGASVTLSLPDGTMVPLADNLVVWTDETVQVQPDVKVILKARGRLTDVRITRRAGDTSRIVFLTVNKSTQVVIEK